MRKANVYFRDMLAGLLSEDTDGYSFEYYPDYLASELAEPISLTFLLTETVYRSNVFFPFFDGLIPEGWLLDITTKNWKISRNDRMGLLLCCCRDCIGAVGVIEILSEED